MTEYWGAKEVQQWLAANGIPFEGHTDLECLTGPVLLASTWEDVSDTTLKGFQKKRLWIEIQKLKTANGISLDASNPTAAGHEVGQKKEAAHGSAPGPAPPTSPLRAANPPTSTPPAPFTAAAFYTSPTPAAPPLAPVAPTVSPAPQETDPPAAAPAPSTPAPAPAPADVPPPPPPPPPPAAPEPQTPFHTPTKTPRARPRTPITSAPATSPLRRPLDPDTNEFYRVRKHFTRILTSELPGPGSGVHVASWDVPQTSEDDRDASVASVPDMDRRAESIFLQLEGSKAEDRASLVMQLCRRVVVQAEALESDTAASEALGAVVARLACMDPALGAAVVAEVRRRCPPAAPEVSRAAPGTDSFRRTMGYLQNEDGSWEADDAYQARLRGAVRLMGGLCAAVPEPPGLGLDLGMRYLERFVNRSVPPSRATAEALEAFLAAAGPRLAAGRPLLYRRLRHALRARGGFASQLREMATTDPELERVFSRLSALLMEDESGPFSVSPSPRPSLSGPPPGPTPTRDPPSPTKNAPPAAAAPRGAPPQPQSYHSSAPHHDAARRDHGAADPRRHDLHRHAAAAVAVPAPAPPPPPAPLPQPSLQQQASRPHVPHPLPDPFPLPPDHLIYEAPPPAPPPPPVPAPPAPYYRQASPPVRLPSAPSTPSSVRGPAMISLSMAPPPGPPPPLPASVASRSPYSSVPQSPATVRTAGSTWGGPAHTSHGQSSAPDAARQLKYALGTPAAPVSNTAAPAPHAPQNLPPPLFPGHGGPREGSVSRASSVRASPGPGGRFPPPSLALNHITARMLGSPSRSAAPSPMIPPTITMNLATTLATPREPMPTIREPSPPVATRLGFNSAASSRRPSPAPATAAAAPGPLSPPSPYVPYVPAPAPMPIAAAPAAKPKPAAQIPLEAATAPAPAAPHPHQASIPPTVPPPQPHAPAAAASSQSHASGEDTSRAASAYSPARSALSDKTRPRSAALNVRELFELTEPVDQTADSIQFGGADETILGIQPDNQEEEEEEEVEARPPATPVTPAPTAPLPDASSEEASPASSAAAASPSESTAASASAPGSGQASVGSASASAQSSPAGSDEAMGPDSERDTDLSEALPQTSDRSSSLQAHGRGAAARDSPGVTSRPQPPPGPIGGPGTLAGRTLAHAVQNPSPAMAAAMAAVAARQAAREQEILAQQQSEAYEEEAFEPFEVEEGGSLREEGDAVVEATRMDEPDSATLSHREEGEGESQVAQEASEEVGENEDVVEETERISRADEAKPAPPTPPPRSEEIQPFAPQSVSAGPSSSHSIQSRQPEPETVQTPVRTPAAAAHPRAEPKPAAQAATPQTPRSGRPQPLPKATPPQPERSETRSVDSSPAVSPRSPDSPQVSGHGGGDSDSEGSAAAKYAARLQQPTIPPAIAARLAQERERESQHGSQYTRDALSDREASGSAAPSRHTAEDISPPQDRAIRPSKQNSRGSNASSLLSKKDSRDSNASMGIPMLPSKQNSRDSNTSMGIPVLPSPSKQSSRDSNASMGIHVQAQPQPSKQSSRDSNASMGIHAQHQPPSKQNSRDSNTSMGVSGLQSAVVVDTSFGNEDYDSEGVERERERERRKLELREERRLRELEREKERVVEQERERLLLARRQAEAQARAQAEAMAAHAAQAQQAQVQAALSPQYVRGVTRSGSGEGGAVGVMPGQPVLRRAISPQQLGGAGGAGAMQPGQMVQVQGPHGPMMVQLAASPMRGGVPRQMMMQPVMVHGQMRMAPMMMAGGGYPPASDFSYIQPDDSISMVSSQGARSQVGHRTAARPNRSDMDDTQWTVNSTVYVDETESLNGSFAGGPGGGQVWQGGQRSQSRGQMRPGAVGVGASPQGSGLMHAKDYRR